MAKARTAYVCNECGAEFSKWQGQCTECNARNSLSEIVLESAAAAKAPASRRAGWAGKIDPPKITALKDVEQTEHRRVSTGIGEFDRVLGGGPVEGAVVLVGGDRASASRRYCCRRWRRWPLNCQCCTSPARSRWPRWLAVRIARSCRWTASMRWPRPASSRSCSTRPRPARG